MKIIYALLSSVLCISTSFIAMEEKQPLIPDNPSPTAAITSTQDAAIFSAITSDINKIYAEQPLRAFFGSPLTEDGMRNVLNTMRHYTLSEEFITQLCNENEHFRTSFSHFIKLAKENYQNVGVNCLDTIENPQINQPTTPLNTIALAIRKYIMNKAKTAIEQSYECRLTIIITSHNDSISCYDICPSTHVLAIGKPTRSRVKLWNLITNHRTHEFHLDHSPKLLSFHPKGSLLACYAQGFGIYIWNVETQQCSYSLPLKDIAHISFFENSKKPLLSVTNYFSTQKIVKLKDKATIIASINLGSQPNKSRNKEPYSTYLSDNSRLDITRKSSFEFYLCKRAIENSKDLNDLSGIKTSLPYQKLTEQEQNILSQTIDAKKDLFNRGK